MKMELRSAQTALPTRQGSQPSPTTPPKSPPRTWLVASWRRGGKLPGRGLGLRRAAGTVERPVQEPPTNPPCRESTPAGRSVTGPLPGGDPPAGQRKRRRPPRAAQRTGGPAERAAAAASTACIFPAAAADASPAAVVGSTLPSFLDPLAVNSLPVRPRTGTGGLAAATPPSAHRVSSHQSPKGPGAPRAPGHVLRFRGMDG
jgi:hypothetical protein